MSNVFQIPSANFTLERSPLARGKSQVAAASQPADGGGASAAAPVRRRRKGPGVATAVAGSSDIFVKAPEGGYLRMSDWNVIDTNNNMVNNKF